MFEQIVDFVVNNREVITAVIVIILGVIGTGRKRAKKVALNMLKESEGVFLNTLKKNSDDYASYIYNKLPKSAKPFLSKKTIKKLIDEALDLVDGLDGK